MDLTHDVNELLATLRTPQGMATLAPAVNEHATAPGRIVINGGLVYDNLFLINGVDVADNLSGNPQNLFIEDAIAEIKTLTSSMTAEYGRFSGGVVNAVTKSGGNRFSGSGRVNFLNPA